CCIILLIWGYIFQAPWIGFYAHQDLATPQSGYHPTKTLWDWLNLLALPFAISFGAFWLNSSHSERASATASEQKHLQDNLDRLSKLLPENTPIPVETGNFISAQTLIVLTQINHKRKRSLIQFLYVSNLISSKRADCIPLKDADLSKVDLS